MMIYLRAAYALFKTGPGLFALAVAGIWLASAWGQWSGAGSRQAEITILRGSISALERDRQDNEKIRKRDGLRVARLLKLNSDLKERDEKIWLHLIVLKCLNLAMFVSLALSVAGCSTLSPKLNISVSGAQKNELPPTLLMNAPKPVPKLPVKNISVRELERAYMQRGRYGEYHRQWVIALQGHITHAAAVKNKRRRDKQSSHLPDFLR